MKIQLKAILLSVVEKRNPKTNEVRHLLSFLDNDGETPEIVSIKAPSSYPISSLKLNSEYLANLNIWKMQDRFGFYIPSVQDLTPVNK
jgi:hypothetical protein